MPRLDKSYPDLLTIKNAAKVAGVSEATLRRWDAAGRLVPRRHPVSGYRLYERAKLLELQRKTGKARDPFESPIPTDFPNFGGETMVVDTLLVILFQERAALQVAQTRAEALAHIERARSAIIPFGNALYAKTACRRLLMTVLDQASHLEPLDLAVKTATLWFSEALPQVKLQPQVVRDAVFFWRKPSRTKARIDAVRSLAKKLGCDAPSFWALIRKIRQDDASGAK